ncbi:MAG: hypothetical protein IPM51_11790 [Sphingobacteriaceae bacterium]|nr:hypothetical protein [Sphingobacteriaceae bacterium]
MENLTEREVQLLLESLYAEKLSLLNRMKEIDNLHDKLNGMLFDVSDLVLCPGQHGGEELAVKLNN